MPQYMLLIYTDPETSPEPGSDEARRDSDVYTEVTQDFHDRGLFVAGDRLEPTDMATAVRVNGSGEAVLTDGPFADTKEHLIGFYVIDVPDLDTALEWAAKVPNVRTGSVEVRPLMPDAQASRAESTTSASAG
jgi:hypothetical protein